MEDGPRGRQSELSKTNGPERLAWPESHTESRGGGFAKVNQANEDERGGHRRAIWRTGHAADRANFQKQTVRSVWRGRSRTRKSGRRLLKRIRRIIIGNRSRRAQSEMTAARRIKVTSGFV